MMEDAALEQALGRAELALARIERAGAAARADRAREAALRDKVRAVVAELDEMIAAAAPVEGH